MNKEEYTFVLSVYMEAEGDDQSDAYANVQEWFWENVKFSDDVDLSRVTIDFAAV